MNIKIDFSNSAYLGNYDVVLRAQTPLSLRSLTTSFTITNPVVIAPPVTPPAPTPTPTPSSCALIANRPILKFYASNYIDQIPNSLNNQKFKLDFSKTTGNLFDSILYTETFSTSMVDCSPILISFELKKGTGGFETFDGGHALWNKFIFFSFPGIDKYQIQLKIDAIPVAQ